MNTEYSDDNISIQKSRDGQRFTLNLPEGYVSIDRNIAQSILVVLGKALEGK